MHINANSSVAEVSIHETKNASIDLDDKCEGNCFHFLYPSLTNYHAIVLSLTNCLVVDTFWSGCFVVKSWWISKIFPNWVQNAKWNITSVNVFSWNHLKQSQTQLQHQCLGQKYKAWHLHICSIMKCIINLVQKPFFLNLLKMIVGPKWHWSVLILSVIIIPLLIFACGEYLPFACFLFVCTM